ncbi:MAG TPA: metallophosphoesterase family protein [Sediminibacterium sp.]|nr:metallophosphoesterase family protein [Sediminibacterium sp.]
MQPIAYFAGQMRIGLLSDTHGFLDDAVFRHFEKCDEIWHAGDFGPAAIAEQLAAFRPLRGVYGNIDGQDIRSHFPEILQWHCESLLVCMKHIGGYPPRYEPATRKILDASRPGLFISGHSHILKIQFDPARNCLHINPGAAGKQGWHQVRTLIRFEVHGANMENCDVIELGKR